MINRRIPVAVALLVCCLSSISSAQFMPLRFDANTENATTLIDNVGFNTAWNTSISNANWVNQLPAQVSFANGNSVVFGVAGFGVGSTSVSVEASVTNVGDMTIGNVLGLSYSFTGQRISGTASTLLLDSHSAVTTNFSNTTGGANLFQNLTLNQGSVIGSASFSVSNSITLGSGSISNVLAGAATATKNSSGTITLSGANTYTGLTTVSAGTLQLGGAGTTGTGALTVNGSGTLNLGGLSRTVGAVNLGGTGAISNGTLTGTSYTSTGGSVSAVLAGSGVTFTNTSGTTNLSGANTYSGLTTISGGAVNLIGSGTTGTGALTVNGTGTLNLGGTSRTVGAVNLGGTGHITNGTLTGTSYTSTGGSISAVLAGSGVSFTNTSGTTSLSGNNTYTGGTVIDGGTVIISSNLGVLADSGSLTINAGGTLNLGTNNETVGTVNLNGGSITGTGTLTSNAGFNVQSGSVGVNLAGSGALVKSTASSITLSGTNSYSGGTTINAGTVLANSTTALGTGLVTVASGASLQGSATIGNAINVSNGGTLALTGTGSGVVTLASGSTLTGNGTYSNALNLAGVTVSPGNSPGTLTINNALSASNTTVFNFELNGADQTVGGGINDLITGITNLTLDGTLNITNFLNAFTTPGGTWRLFEYSGTLTDNGLVLGSAPALPVGLSYIISTGTAGRVDLIITAVPEPSSMVLVVFGAVGLAIRRRNRR